VKKIILLSVWFVVLIITSCAIQGPHAGVFNDIDDEMADSCVKDVSKAIKSRDKKAIKSLFSKKACKEAENIDSDIDNLFSFIQGDVVSWERKESPVSGEEYHYGKTLKELEIWYVLETNKQKYAVFLYDFHKNTIEPDNQGLYTIMVLKAEDKDHLKGYIEDYMIPGVCIPIK